MTIRPGQTVRGACTGAALAIAALILYESIQERDRPGIPDLSTNEAYIGHFAIYAVMTLCALVALAPRSLPAVGAMVLLAAGFGATLELYQVHVPTRTGSAGDALADTAGAICGLVVYALLATIVAPPGRRQPTKL